MALRRTIPIQLDKMRNLRYGTNSLCMTEQLTGLKLLQVDPNSASFLEMRAILFAGLCWEDDKLTLAKVGDLIDEYGGGTAYMNKCIEALTAHVGGDEGNGQTPTAEAENIHSTNG
jgi:hypothetical protein